MDTRHKRIIIWSVVFLLIISAGSTLLNAQSPNWTHLSGPSGPSEVVAITGNGSAIFAMGNDSYNYGILGIYASYDFGVSWKYLSADPQPGTSGSAKDLEIDASGNLYYVDVNILMSSDSGATWQELETGGGLFTQNQDLEIDADGRLYVQQNGDNGIILSEDSGTNWSTILTTSGFLDGLFIDVDQNVYAYGDAGVLRSSDQGVTWDTLYTGEVEAFSTGPDGRLIVTRDQSLHYSDDDGDSWTEITGDNFYNSLHYDGQNTLFAEGGLLVSTDGGETWTTSEAGLPEPEFGDFAGQLVSNPEGETVIMAGGSQYNGASLPGAQAVFSFDYSSTAWAEIPADGFTASVAREIIQMGDSLAVIFGNRVFISADDGNSWNELLDVPDENWISIAQSSSGDFFLGTNTSVYWSPDGNTWNETSEARAAKLYATADNVVYARYLSSLWRWDSDTEAWIDIGDNLDSSFDDLWLNSHNDQLYAVGSGVLYTTEDHGDTWIEVATDEFSGTANRLTNLAFQDANTFYAFTLTNLRKSSDAGQTWEVVRDSLEEIPFYALSGNVSNFRVTADGTLIFKLNDAYSDAPDEYPAGLYMSGDVGASLQLITPAELPAAAIQSVTQIENQIYLSTAGLGLYKSDALTTVNSESPGGVVTSFILEQNYPNPFNPVTTIQFTLPSDGYVDLTLFDLKGQQVATILRKNLTAGRHQVDFDGSHYSSGVYFYRLQTSTQTLTKKMILLK